MRNGTVSVNRAGAVTPAERNNMNDHMKYVAKRNIELYKKDKTAFVERMKSLTWSALEIDEMSNYIERYLLK